jgi:hypothetical protein
MIKLLFVTDCLECHIDTIRDLRVFAERFFTLFGYSITDFAFSFNTEKGRYHKSYKYTAKKKVSFDGFDMEDFSLAQFSFVQKHEEGSTPIEFEFIIDKNNEGYFSITSAFSPKSGDCSFEQSSKQILDILHVHFRMKYFLMDTMDAEKRPDRFVLSMLNKNLRDELENSVAYSIQLSTLIHHKLPFLFQYSYFISEQKVDALNPVRISDDSYSYELYFPELMDKVFSQYHESPKWNDAFKTLSDLGIIDLTIVPQ